MNYIPSCVIKLYMYIHDLYSYLGEGVTFGYKCLLIYNLLESRTANKTNNVDADSH